MSDTPSPRRAAAERIAEFIIEHHLANPYGGDVVGAGRYYSVGLAVPAYLDGDIRVYSENFILIDLMGRLAHGAQTGVYTSVDDAIAYLQALLVDHDSEAAAAVPTKLR